MTARTLLLFALIGVLAGCEQLQRDILLAQNEPLRPQSLEPWHDRSIDGEPAMSFAFNRLAIVFPNADTLFLQRLDERTVSVRTSLRGFSTGMRVGSAVALTDDGYFLTAAHCVEEPPFLMVARCTDGETRQSPARLVWIGLSDGSCNDFAILHAPGMVTTPARWADLGTIDVGTPIIITGGITSHGVPLAAGSVCTKPTPRECEHGTEIVMAIPAIPGDSGGPAFTVDGALVGVVVSAEFDFFSSDSDAICTAVHPDPAIFTEIVARDRAAMALAGSMQPAPPPATVSLPGQIMFQSGLRRVVKIADTIP